MKKYLSCAIAVFVATTVVAIASPETDMIQSKEKAAWQAFKDKKGDDFKNLVDKDFRGVYADGIASLQKELEDMKKWDMKSFSISDFSAFSDEPDVIVTTYVVKIEGMFDGKDATGTYNAGSVWKKEKDTWLAIFHTNAKQEKAAK
jgi:ketosteroid isomerase-like protein